MDSLPTPIIIILIIFCLLGSFIFTCTENALTNCDIYHYKVEAEENNFTSKLIFKMASKFDDTLVSILVGNNIVQALLSNISAILFLSLVRWLNWPEGIESVISTIVVTIIVYIFTEYFPKILSKKYPDLMAHIIIYPVCVFYILLFPIILLFRLILKVVKKISKSENTLQITKEEFIDKTIEAEDEVLEAEEKQIIKAAFKFDTISVNQVLTKKENIYSISIEDLTIDELNKIILASTYSRIPVYEDNKDNIIGILTVKTYFSEYLKDKHLDVRSVLTKPIIVNETDKVDDIFAKFNEEKTHIALVYNDKEEFIGMITMQDILEELVGDINETTSINKEVRL